MKILVQYKRIESTDEKSLLKAVNDWLLENTSDFTEEPDVMRSRDYDYENKAADGTSPKITYYADIKYKTNLTDYKADR